MDSETRFFVAVKGLIWYGGTFLIIRRGSQARDGEGMWELPGGRLEFAETPEAALHRELDEEVGLSVEVIEPLFTWTFIRGDVHQTVGITFSCTTTSNEVRLSPEHDAYAWITAEEMDDYSIYPDLVRDLQGLCKV